MVQDNYYTEGMQDMQGMEDKEGKEHMVWEMEEEMVFYISVADRVWDEWAMAQNYNYHNNLHSILAYIYHY